MALIVCPECGKNFSDRAAACPECGCPTSEIVGHAPAASAGQISIADNAFDDGRYDEAYQLYAQLFAQYQSDPKIVIRLGLATAAKDYFNNGIPNSTRDMIARGMDLAKNGVPSQDAYVLRILPYIHDIKKVIEDTKSAVLAGLSTALGQTAPMRSAGSMMVDALFSPAISANRNLYEDRRTAENNTRILQSAIANKQAITATLDAFGSYVLRLVAGILSMPLKSDDPLYVALGSFVISGEDARVYTALCASKAPQANIYGLCYGAERTLLELANNTSFFLINGKNRLPGLGIPKGQLILTNYRVMYRANKPQQSFEMPLNDLIRVEVDGPQGFNTFIGLTFRNNIKVHISPEPPGSQAVYVAMLNEQLKMPNR